MTWSDPAYEGIANLVNLRTGLQFLPSRHDSAELGMRQAMARAGIGDASRYHALLLGSPAAFDDLVGELAVGETYFFREPAQFEFIRHEVLPEFRRRATRGHDPRMERRLRFRRGSLLAGHPAGAGGIGRPGPDPGHRHFAQVPGTSPPRNVHHLVTPRRRRGSTPNLT